MKKLIAGNWKMNTSHEEAMALTNELLELAGSCSCQDCGCGSNKPEILVCPPFTWLSEMGYALEGSNIKLGAQDCHQEDKGAYTGCVSAEMIKNTGASYVILGHSERREYFKESNELVKAKSEKTLEKGMTPIVCVGEDLAQRESGEFLNVVETQVRESIPASDDLVVAYEPVWAIGTGKVPTTMEVEEVCAHIKKVLTDMGRDTSAVRVLYGGSVKGSNAGEILSQQSVDGVLVGGAALKADGFMEIVNAAK